MKGFVIVLGLGLTIFVTCPAETRALEILVSDHVQPKQESSEIIPTVGLTLHTCDADCYWRLFCSALGEQESNNNDSAVGDHDLAHKAYGRYQIRQPFLDDSGKDYSIEDMLDPHKAEWTMIGYYKRYQPYTLDAAMRHNSKQAWFNLARIHNGGGPNGMIYPETAIYAREVMEIWRGLTCHQVVVD